MILLCRVLVFLVVEGENRDFFVVGFFSRSVVTVWVEEFLFWGSFCVLWVV